MNRQDIVPLLDQVSAADGDALAEAVALGEVAARVGFDWEDAAGAFEKLQEEIQELAEHIQAGERGSPEALASELGDVLFAACMVARKAGLDPASALGLTNAKFRRRFLYMERALADEGKRPEEVSLDQMEALWQASKTKTP